VGSKFPGLRAVRSVCVANERAGRVSCGSGGQGEGCWSCEVVALSVFDAEGVQGVEFGLGVDAFGEEDGADIGAEVHQRGGEGAAYRVGVDASGEGDVEFDDVGLEVEDVSEAGEAGAGRSPKPVRNAPVGAENSSGRGTRAEGRGPRTRERGHPCEDERPWAEGQRPKSGATGSRGAAGSSGSSSVGQNNLHDKRL
jgi:hypothetical protein